jgi:ABC-type transporter Mla subunit MlaD
MSGELADGTVVKRAPIDPVGDAIARQNQVDELRRTLMEREVVPAPELKNMTQPVELSFEGKARARLASLFSERDEYIRVSQERVNNLQAQLNQTVGECNGQIMGFAAAIKELETLLGIVHSPEEAMAAGGAK